MEELRVNIINLCNESGLPLEAILFVVRDVYRDVNETFQNYQKAQLNIQQDSSKEEK